MKSVLPLCILFLLGCSLFASDPATNSISSTQIHEWQYINYPWNPGSPTFCIGWPSGGREKSMESSRGLRLDILGISQGFAFFKTNAISARLYRANGDVVEPTAEGKKLLNGPVAVSTASMPGEEPLPQVLTYFPWGSNTLEESWIEVTIAPERYWVEIPYGFDRDPANPLALANTNGPPRFPPEMNSLTEHDHVVRWAKVFYDLGHAPDGSELKLIQSNPFDAQSEVDLYNFPHSVNVYSPFTRAYLLENDDTVVTGRCVNIHLDDNYLRRTDTFDFITRGEESPRCWGKIKITVNGQSYYASVPSSLYRYCHGHAFKPGAIDYLSKLRVGMPLQEADLLSRNYTNESIRNHPDSSVPGQYRCVFYSDTNAITLQFDDSGKLVSWR